MVKCREVLQCSGSTSNKVLTLLEYIQTIGSCCLYVFCYYHSLAYSLGSIFYQYMVVFLLNTVIYVFLLLGLCILIIDYPD